MKRRDFITLLGGAAAAWPLAARAQQAERVPRIAIFMDLAEGDPEGQARVAALKRGLQDLGWIEGRNLRIESRWAAGEAARMRPLAEELVSLAPEVIVSSGGPTLTALQQATRAIPLVFGQVVDPVAAGFVDSLSRPGGNITGISLMSPDLDGKRQDILIEAVPNARRIAVLADSNVATLEHLKSLDESARQHGKDLLVVRVANASELVPATNNASTQGAFALNVLSSPMLHLNRRVIIERATELRLPSIYQWPETADDGGLLGYGPSFVEIFRERARMVAKVLRGVKPADMPVEQPSTFKLVVNLKTAKAMNYTIPPGLLLRADKLIE